MCVSWDLNYEYELVGNWEEKSSVLGRVWIFLCIEVGESKEMFVGLIILGEKLINEYIFIEIYE